VESFNWNKILIQWDGCTRRYWVWPDDVKFRRGVDVSKFVAIPRCFVRYTEPPLPSSNDVKCSYEYNFGTNLRKIRESRGLSQAKLGELMGKHMRNDSLAQSTIAYRERCSYSPNGAFTDAAARVLNVPPFVFFLPLNDCDVFPLARQFLTSLASSLCK
jgi:hypothetical protein